jgi:Pyruvate/2-oxoacid:ferredoxin oxidoreductase delta subunit
VSLSKDGERDKGGEVIGELMDEKGLAFHYVCTWEDANRLVESHDRFWVENCGCREKNERGCTRSRMDLCLMFRSDVEASGGSGKKEISRADVDKILREAKEKHLVTRPFRNANKMTETDGICFCCDDCCEYFINPSVPKCDKGAFIEKTDRDKCTDCGSCADICYFGARKMRDDKLVLYQGNCYGCGLCMEVCPDDCIKMVTRD